MLQCPYCPTECQTPQGLSGHIRMRHPGDYSNGSGASSSRAVVLPSSVQEQDGEDGKQISGPLAISEELRSYLVSLDDGISLLKELLDRVTSEAKEKDQKAKEGQEELAQVQEEMTAEITEVNDRLKHLELMVSKLDREMEAVYAENRENILGTIWGKKWEREPLDSSHLSETDDAEGE